MCVCVRFLRAPPPPLGAFYREATRKATIFFWEGGSLENNTPTSNSCRTDSNVPSTAGSVTVWFVCPCHAALNARCAVGEQAAKTEDCYKSTAALREIYGEASPQVREREYREEQVEKAKEAEWKAKLAKLVITLSVSFAISGSTCTVVGHSAAGVERPGVSTLAPAKGIIVE